MGIKPMVTTQVQNGKIVVVSSASGKVDAAFMYPSPVARENECGFPGKVRKGKKVPSKQLKRKKFKDCSDCVEQCKSAGGTFFQWKESKCRCFYNGKLIKKEGLGWASGSVN